MGLTPFTAHVESSQGVARIALSGELDLGTVPILEEHLVRVEADGASAIMVDLRELTFIGSEGLRAFLAARGRAEANGRQLILVGANAPVRRIFEVTDTESILDDQDVASLLGR